MNTQEIKTECEKMYAQLREAENKLKELRGSCPHENTFEGNWSYRIGSIIPAIICDDCGSLIKLKQGLFGDVK